MTATSTEEKVWRGDPSGLREVLAEADKAEQAERKVDARVARAYAYYWYSTWRLNPLRARWDLARARHYTQQVIDILETGKFYLTAAQCEIIGTILLHKRKWGRNHVRQARCFLFLGLNKSPHNHTKALINVGLAESHAQLMQRDNVEYFIKYALALEFAVLDDSDQVLACRQFVQVLWRIRNLYTQLEMHEDAAHIKLAARHFIQSAPADLYDELRASFQRK